jgi:stearoyl-CoA desaturase (delta-9 desaturase)
MLEHDYPNAAHYVPDLLRARPIQWINRRYLQIALFGLFVPGLVCGLVTWSFFAGLSAVLWGGFIRMAFLGHTIWAINSVLHRFGSKPFATPDNSHNAGIVSLLTFGEAWHNNHHAFPTSAKFGVRHGWTDPGWWLVKSLEAAGCVAEVREPADSMIEERLREGRQYYDSE